ncbi:MULTISPECIES: GrpB family protein [Lysinibacillus]|uniref:GrpB family protein n=1 Tax=Lysinibacillus TaxID=400634 RepID=UPI00083C9A9C|nr:GrpB family protein [Lysinibacillus xylanilyticus]
MRKAEIRPWTEDWVTQFYKEEIILKDIFKDELLEIHHIGSTAIPTIGFAKPIVDILVIVNDIEKVDLYNEKMSSIGYDPRGENGIPGRRYFPKNKERRTHHVHIYQEGNENIRIHLDFKEYLINNPEDARSYGDLKIKLAKQFPNDIYKYQEGKEFFVNELVKKAINWSLKRTSC